MKSGFFLCYVLFSVKILCAQSQPDKMAEITQYIRQNYFTTVNIDSILNAMVHDYLNDPATIVKLFDHLDPHSNYLDETLYSELRTSLRGNFFGIGIAFGIQRDTIIVTKIFDGGPADKAGMRTGDKIIKVDDQDFTGKYASYDSIVGVLRGEKGTSLDIKVYRNQDPSLIPMHLVRDQITVRTVDVAYMPQKHIGYIKLNAFGSATAEDMRAALQKLNAAGMQKLILDLRDNEGGYFDAATAVADEFIAGNALLVYTEGRPGSRKDYVADKKGLFENGSMVVLVSSATASAAEILTGALQDNKRAVVMGTRSYGKGLVQELYPLSDSVTCIKLTTAKYYTPSGRCIQRSYEDGTQAYLEENNAIRMNNGDLTESMQKNGNTNWGIIPDRYVAEDTTAVNKLYNQLYIRYYLSQFAYGYYADNIRQFSGMKHPDELFKNPADAEILFKKFTEYVKMQETMPQEYFPALIYTQEDMLAARSKITVAIKAYIAEELWAENGYYPVMQDIDQEVQAAMQVLK